MKPFSVVVFLLFSVLPMVYAQTTHPTGHFSYQRQQTVDGQVTGNSVQDLFYTGEESIYVVYYKRPIVPSDTVRTSDDKGEYKTVTADLDADNFTYYKNYNTRLMVSQEILANGKICQVRDTIPNLRWLLTAEKKKIGTYICQKATTTFRCANYVAWFTTAIPLSVGPWKLGGLPGLIVEVTNERVHATYTLLSADYPNAKVSYPIMPSPVKGSTYSFVDFAAIQRKEQDKLRVFYKGASTDNSQKTVSFNGPECYDKP